MAHTNTENALNSRTKTIVIFDHPKVPSQSFFGHKIDLTNVNNLSTIDCRIPKSKYDNLHVVHYTSQNIFYTIVFEPSLKLYYDILEFTTPHNYQNHYRMESFAPWNGRKQECWGYCFRDTKNASHCMCNPSLMHDKEYSILAGDYIYIYLIQ